jgi:uncharacterized protein (DUF927 family)
MEKRTPRRRLHSVKPRAHRQQPPPPDGDADQGAMGADFASAMGEEIGHIPPGFARLAGGIYAVIQGDDDEDGNPTEPTYEFVCSPLEVVAATRDDGNVEWGRLLVVKDPDDTVHRWAMPMHMLAGEGTPYREELLRLGLRIASGGQARRDLHDFITRAHPAQRARSVLRTGWHAGRYVTADGGVIGDGNERVVLQMTVAPTSTSALTKGSLQEWHTTVAAPCLDNSRLLFAVSVALAPPLLELVGHESGGFHLRGPSSIGKTTVARMATSVWGSPQPGGILRTWRGTDNGLEAVAALHGDALLVLDELSQVDARVAGEIAYMLASGTGKSRARRDGGVRAPFTWRLIFFSTGEITLADKMLEGGRRVRAGQEARLVDIPADAGAGLGVFEDLHGAETADRFAQQLDAAAAATYGTAAAAYLRELVRRRAEDTAALIAQIHTMRERFLVEHLPAHPDGQVSRVATRFALVAVAGELGAAFGVLPWPAAVAFNGVGACFNAWLAARPGGSGSAEIAQALEQVRLFIHMHGASRFDNLNVEKPVRTINRAGFIHTSEFGSSRPEYCVFPEVWRAEVCKGHDPTNVARWASDAGLLRRGDGNHWTDKRPFEGRRVRVYVVQLPTEDGDE